MEIQPALHGWLGWDRQTIKVAPDQNATLKSGALSLWIKSGFAERMEATGFIAGKSDEAIICAVFGRYFNWPGLSKTELDKRSPAELTAKWLLEGKKLPDVLHGEFVLAIWEQKKRCLTLMTDPMGTRPLFYVCRNDGVAFATDVESLKAYCKSPDDFESDRLMEFFSHKRQSLSEKILVSGVERVLPGSRVVIDRSGHHAERYWQPENAPHIRYAKRQDYYDHARELLRQCITIRTPSSGNIGAHVSGGLDSAIVAAIASDHRRALGKPLPHGYAWQPAAKESDAATLDQSLRDDCVQAIGIECSSLELTNDVLRDYLQFDPATYPLTGELLSELGVMRNAKKRKISTVLSGWGGDQAFSFRGKKSENSNPFIFLARCLKAQLKYRPKNLPSFYLGNISRPSRLDHIKQMISVRTTRGSQLTHLNMNGLFHRMDCWSIFGAHHDLQYSYPLLDHELIEFALGVPADLYIDEKYDRLLMREAMRGAVPENIRQIKNKDEPARIDAVYKSVKEAAGWILERLDRGQYEQDRSELLEMELLKDHVQNFESGEFNAISKVIQALSFVRLKN